MDRLSRFIEAGKGVGYNDRKTQERPCVKVSESINSRIKRYVVESSGNDIEVLIWTDKRSSIIEAVDQYGMTNSSAVNTAKDTYYDETVADSPLTEMCRALPDAIYRRLVNNSEYGVIQNDVSDIEPVITEFAERIIRYAVNPIDILSAYDNAINACNGYTKHDLSWVSDTIIKAAKRYEAYVPNLTPDEFTELICRRSNDLSRTWLLEPTFNITDEQAASAFLTLFSEKNLSDCDIKVMDMLLDRMTDLNDLAKKMIRGADYYSAEKIIMREKRRGHIRLAKEIADKIDSTTDIRSHMREAALIRRDLGIPDTGEYFIKSFIEEPNGKRLIDVKVAHPMANTEEVIAKAWRKHGKEPHYMCFFAENGFSANVVKWLSKRTDDDLLQEITENPCEYEHLCLILLGTGTYDITLRIALMLLGYMIRNNNNEGITDTIDLCDRIVDSAGRPADMIESCRSFRSANSPRKGFWKRDDWTAF